MNAENNEVLNNEVEATEVEATEAVAEQAVEAEAAAPAAEKAPRDKGARAKAIYDEEMAKRNGVLEKGGRGLILERMQAELPCTLAASVAHFNNARIANGGIKNTRGPRKPKDTAADASASAAADGQAAPAAQAAPSDEVWCVELENGTKQWFSSEVSAREKAATLKNVKEVFRDLEVEAEG